MSKEGDVLRRIYGCSGKESLKSNNQGARLPGQWLLCAGEAVSFSALMLFIEQEEGRLAHKNLCFRTHCNIFMAVNVSGPCTAGSTMWVNKSFGLSVRMLRIRNDWRLRIKG